MKALLRTLVGLGFGWVGAALFGMLGRLQRTSGYARRTQRRTFVRNAALGATGVVGTITAAGFGALMWPNKTGAFGRELTVPAAEVPPPNGVPYLSRNGRFFLVHNDDGLLALYTKCPHLGCTVPWVGPAENPQAFQCPCHGSMYDYAGFNTGGPAPRPMDLMAVTVEGGDVKVDTGNITTRAEYVADQAVPYA